MNSITLNVLNKLDTHTIHIKKTTKGRKYKNNKVNYMKHNSIINIHLISLEPNSRKKVIIIIDFTLKIAIF